MLTYYYIRKLILYVKNFLYILKHNVETIPNSKMLSAYKYFFFKLDLFPQSKTTYGLFFVIFKGR